MSSAILLAKILLLLMNVRKVKDSKSQDQCIWVCDVVNRVEYAVGTHEQIGAIYIKFNKQVLQNCTDETTDNSWDSITVGINFIVAPDASKFSFSDFLTFGIEHVSLRQLLFGNKKRDPESVNRHNSSVSCCLRIQALPTETGRGASNGLDVLYSPLFYLRNSVTNSQKVPYMGYVEIGGTVYLSAGFTDSTKAEYRLKFDLCYLTHFRNLSIFLVVLFTLFSPSTLLTLFCANIKTAQIERLSRAAKVENDELYFRSESTKSATEQEESIELVVDPPRVILDSDHDISFASAHRDAGKEFLSPYVATKQGKLRETGTGFPSWTIEDLGLDSSTAAAKHDALGIRMHPINQENSSRDGHSEMAGLPRPAAREKIPPATVPEFSHTQSDDNSGLGASGSSSSMEKIEPNKLQTGVQHQNIKNRKLDSVQVMDVGAPASPVGLRSFIANKVFSNSKSLSLPYQFVKFVILIMFPPFIPILIDVFVLAIPRLFPTIGSNLPSPFLIKSVFIFTHEVCPGFMYFCLICYTFRIVCFCFLQSSSNWVPSFLCRKHLVCFIRNHYLSQLIYPSNSWSACDECKKAPDLPKHCEIPVNIKCNDSCSLLEIFKKDWKDVSRNIYPEHIRGRFLGSEDESSCPVVWKVVCPILGGLLFILLVITDTVASLPIISLCYGRVWFTKNWCQSRYRQAGCLIVEFFGICFSVVWITYFLLCCFLSMMLALSSFFIATVNYPREMFSYLVINCMVWHIIWSCYSSFTNVYDDLLLKLFSACSKDHKSELNQYKEGNVQYIPYKLFTSACFKIKPVGNSVKKLLFHLSVWIVGLFFFLSLIFIAGSNTDTPIFMVLAPTVTVLALVNPIVWDFLVTRGKKKERKDEVLKKAAEDHVDSFFKGKLD